MSYYKSIPDFIIIYSTGIENAYICFPCWMLSKKSDHIGFHGRRQRGAVAPSWIFIHGTSIVGRSFKCYFSFFLRCPLLPPPWKFFCRRPCGFSPLLTDCWVTNQNYTTTVAVDFSTQPSARLKVKIDFFFTKQLQIFMLPHSSYLTICFMHSFIVN